MRVTALLLAAGHARRFGSDKRLLPVQAEDSAHHSSLLKYTLSKYLSVFDQCVVVIRDPDAALAVLERMPNVIIVRQVNPQAGMGDNIGLAMQRSEVAAGDAVAIALADMPLVRTQTLNSLCDHARHDCIVRPVYEGQRGHPVIFGQQFFAELSQLSGDTGARGIVAAHPQQILDIPFDDEGILIDIDTAADWERWRHRL